MGEGRGVEGVSEHARRPPPRAGSSRTSAPARPRRARARTPSLSTIRDRLRAPSASLDTCAPTARRRVSAPPIAAPRPRTTARPRRTPPAGPRARPARPAQRRRARARRRRRRPPSPTPHLSSPPRPVTPPRPRHLWRRQPARARVWVWRPRAAAAAAAAHRARAWRRAAARNRRKGPTEICTHGRAIQTSARGNSLHPLHRIGRCRIGASPTWRLVWMTPHQNAWRRAARAPAGLRLSRCPGGD